MPSKWIPKFPPGVLKKHALESLWQGALTGLIIGFLFGFASRFGRRIFASLSDLIGLHPAQLVLSVVTIGAGISAYWFKQKKQRWYGIVEIMFGAMSGVAVAFGISPRASSLTQWATLIGCAYVIARGLNNYAEAKEKEGSAPKSTSA